ncbi:Jasmonic acid-amido synthetase JAR2 [Hordeum vulgare]|nr:Jasmonic acid-amido synthetase JAR2 [Hordeum vulgare]
MSTLLSGLVLRRGASLRLLPPVSRRSSQANGEAARTAKQSPGWGVGSLNPGGIEAGHGSSGTSRVEACRGVVSFVRSGCSITSGSSSSGTTQGKRKYLLFNEELVKSTTQIYRTSYAFRNRITVTLSKLHLLPAFFLWCQPPGATTNMSENHGDNTDAMESADQEKRQEDDAHTTSYGSANMNGQLSGALNGDQGGINTEAYSTPKAPDGTMKFDTLEDAIAHYKLYALRNGFVIRTEYTRTREENTMTRALVVCGKYDKPKQNKEGEQDVQNPKGIMKKRKRGKIVSTECPAHLYLKHTYAWWRVGSFEDNHNYPLIRKPSLTKFLASHRHIPKEEVDFLWILHECNIKTARQMQPISWFYDDPNVVPYTTQDLANQRAKFCSEYRNAERGNTIAYFEELGAKDPDFYWRIKLDDEDRVENMYLIDGPSRGLEEFEEKWWNMLDEHGQSDNEHFHWLWENRECWVPVYYMHNFFLFLQITTRSEGFNSMLKKYVNPNNLLVEFAKQYTMIQAKVPVSVAKEHVQTIYKEMDTYSFNPLELQVQGLYTQNIYSKFQMEMKVKTGYRCNSLQDGTFRCSSVRGIIPKYGIGTTMWKQTWMKGHIHALDASSSEMGYYAHMCYE